MGSFKKSVAAGLLALACVCSSAVSVYAVSDGITVKMDDIAYKNNYAVRGYYSENDGTPREVTGTKNADGSYFFPGVPNNAAYSNFYYEIYNRNGERVVNQTLGYIGDLQYADTNASITVDVPLTYDDITIANIIDSGGDPNEYIREREELKNIPATSGNGNQGTSSTTQGSSQGVSYLPEPTVTTPPPEVITQGIGVRVNGSPNIDVAMSHCGVMIYLTDETGNVEAYRCNTLMSEFSLVKEISEGTYSVSYKSESPAYKDVTGPSSITVTGDGVSWLDITVTPACVLTVNKTVNGSQTQVNFKVGNVGTTYNTSTNNRLAVAPGSKYQVVDLSSNTAFDIAIPSTATECVLDLGTSTGVPINDKAYTDAQLNTTASADNPFNIPVTSDVSATADKDKTGFINWLVIGGMTIMATVIKFFRKSEK